jgi:signal transduction histidine kinase
MGTSILVLLFLLAIINLALGVGVVRLGVGKEAKLFLLILSASFVWIVTNALYVSSESYRFALALASYGAAAAMSLGVYLFCQYLGGQSASSKRTNLAVAVLGSVFVLLCMIPGVIGIYIQPSGAIETNTIGLAFFGIAVIYCLVAGVLKLLPVMSEQRNRYVLYGLCVAAIIGLVFNLVLPFVGVYDYVAYGPMGTLFFVGVSAYAIVRHGLFDIKTAAVRSAAYVIALMTLSLLYFGAAYVLSALFFKDAVSAGVNVGPINIILALTLAFLFQPVKHFFDKITDQLFFKNQYSIDTFITQIGDVSTSTTSLHALLQRASKTIQLTLKASYVAFFIHRKAEHDSMVGSGKSPRLNMGERAVLARLAGKNRKDIVVYSRIQNSKAAKVAMKHDCAIMVPLSSAGMLLIGGRRGGSYTKRDVRALRAIQNELIIAIENTRSLQEVRELNSTLQLRIEEATRELRSSNRRLRQLDATKDEFMSIASHQLRTPLTSIKGYISLLLDGDLGKVPLAQKKVLKEAFDSSERMVSLISDFLNVSRLQTGRFVIDRTEANLEKIVLHEFETLQQSAKARGLTLRLVKPKQPLPELFIDEMKIRQVIMNFIDNALYYTKEGGEVVVEIAQRNEAVEVKIKDSGIGVPEAEQEQLFSKFFRATNAHKRRPDGTGVGLFLAKKVIDGHGGEILFESKEDKGSTFGFRLPLRKVLVPKKVE